MSQKKLKALRRKEKENKNVFLKKEKNILTIKEILKRNWKFLLILLVGVTLLYLNSLKGAFVSDDYATIPHNPLIMDFSYAIKGWMGGLINWLIANTFGIESPIPYHVFSLFLYLLNIVAVFVFFRLLSNKKVTQIATVLFAVLPIHVESVSWIAGRPYLLNGLFILMSLIALVYFLKTEKKKYIGMFLLLAFLTFAAEKTRSTALPLLGLLYWVSFDHKFKKKINLGKVLLVFVFLFLIVVVILWPQVLARIQSVNSGINASDSIYYNPFFQYPTSIAKYLQLLWMPLDLTLYHTMYILPAWLNWLVLVNYLVALVYFFVKDKKIFFALAFIFVAAAPSMAPVKISWLVAERYMFLGSIGFAMFLGIIFEKIWKKNRIVSLVLITLLVSFYGTRVFLRNVDWQSNHNLWVSTCQVSPNSHNAWNNIGDDYDKLEQYENAIKGFRQSTLVKKNYADAYHNMANILFKIKKYDLARNTYQTATSYKPELYQSYVAMIQMDLMLEDYNSAWNDLMALKKLQPNNVQVWYLEALIDSKIEKEKEAVDILEKILVQFPDFKLASDLLSELLR